MNSNLIGKIFILQHPYRDKMWDEGYSLGFDQYYKIIDFDGCCYTAMLVDYYIEQYEYSQNKTPDGENALVVDRSWGKKDELDELCWPENWKVPTVRVFSPQQINGVCLFNSLEEAWEEGTNALDFLKEWKAEADE